tara:strand:+ start:1350 stop:2369 length:1020 start_codon:yes stop_codon:yes gene_type:complete
MFSSYDIARFSDLVYSEVISKNQFESLNLKNVQTLTRDKDLIFYKQSKFTLSSGDVIFTHTGNLFNLFFLIRDLHEDFQLTLITHQSDTSINKRLYSKKPKCIKNWYALNKDYEANDLFSLPLGIANEYSYKKNITSKNIDKKKYEYYKQNINVYINFSESTNETERLWIKDYFKDFAWVDIENKTLSINEYAQKIEQSGFVICPWGNGFDSHRIWETLFLGSIPIIKRHQTFTNLEGLPIYFVDDFREVNEDSLKKFMNSIIDKNLNLEKLNLSYWEHFVKKDQTRIPLSTLVNESSYVAEYYQLKSKIKSFVSSKLKILKFYLLKIRKLNRNIRKSI